MQPALQLLDRCAGGSTIPCMHPTLNRRAFLRNSLLLAGAAALCRPLSYAADLQGKPLPANKRERMLAWLAGDIDYVPAAFFMHFDAEHKVGLPAAQKHTEFFRQTEMDFVKIQYEQQYTPLEWLQKPSDWAKLQPHGLDFYEAQLVTVRELVKNHKSEALVVMTPYSPWMWAGHSATLPVLLRHMKEDPEAVKRGLDTLTESQMLFVRECIKIGVDGFYMATQGSETGQFDDPQLFHKYVKPSDLVAMRAATAACPFNILHVCDYNAPYASYDAVSDYPGHVVNCNPQLTTRTMSWQEIGSLFKRPCCGGLEKKGVLSKGTPAEVEKATTELLRAAPRRFMLGSECTVPSGIQDNLRTAIRTAHAFKRA